MCLLFLSVNNDANPDEYKLVLVNNRDEYWARPTKFANFWSNDVNCISGLDEEPGREGGTWLGMNRNGRVGILLNILGLQHPDMRGRGKLVTDYITSEEDPESYLSHLSQIKSEYNGFHLLLLDKRNGKFVVEFLTNSGVKADEDINIDIKNCIGVCNSPYSTPWQKIVHGKEEFQSIINKYPLTDQKEELTEELMKFMMNKTQFYPDNVLYEQAKKTHTLPIIKERSARCVWSPSISYSTRTTTVVFISGSDECDYTEKSLISPIDPDNPQYTTNSFNFNLS